MTAFEESFVKSTKQLAKNIDAMQKPQKVKKGMYYWRYCSHCGICMLRSDRHAACPTCGKDCCDFSLSPEGERVLPTELEIRKEIMAWVANGLTLLEDQIGDDAATLESWIDNAELIDEAFRVEGRTTKLAMMCARVSCVRTSIRGLKNALTTNPKLTQYERNTDSAAADPQNQSG